MLSEIVRKSAAGDKVFHQLPNWRRQPRVKTVYISIEINIQYRGRRAEDLNKLNVLYMIAFMLVKVIREKSRRKRTVTSSLNEKFTDQLRNRIVAKVGVFRPPPPLLKQASGQIFKDDVHGFPPISDISFMVQIFSLAMFYDNVIRGEEPNHTTARKTGRL
jgi:hypothetical protein